MATKTFVNLQDEVINYGFDATSYRTRIKDWLNQAYQQMARHAAPRSLLTTVSLTTTASNAIVSTGYPTDVSRIDSIFNTTQANTVPVWLQPMGLGELASQSSGARGTPVYYQLDTGGLRVWPVPDAAYTLTMRYYKKPTALSADGDLATWDDVHLQTMICYAVAQAYLAEDDPEMYKTHFEAYRTYLGEFVGDTVSETTDAPELVPGTFSSPPGWW